MRIVLFLNPKQKFDNFLCFLFSEVYPESSQISETELFAKTIKGFQALIFFIKHSIFDVLQRSEYASDFLSAIITFLEKCTKNKKN